VGGTQPGYATNSTYNFHCAGENGGFWGNGSTVGAKVLTRAAALGDGEPRVIAAGEGHLCRLRLSDGLVRCTGANAHGQLGDGSSVSRTTMVEVPGKPFGALGASMSRTCAYARQWSEYRCWGSTIGPFSQTPTPVPVAIAGLVAPAKPSIAPSWSHTCALGVGSTGVVRVCCWGYDFAGQLGNGAAGDSMTPAKVKGI
jgi:hypothetical protein